MTEEEKGEQLEYEEALHAVVWPELDEEPEVDPELDEEMDEMVWEMIRGLE